MNGVALALHGGATGGLPLASYLERIKAAGVGGIEWCLPAAWGGPQLGHLKDALPWLAQLHLFAHLRCAIPPEQRADDAWEQLGALIRRIAEQGGQPVQLVLEAAGGPLADEAAYRQATVAAVRRINQLCGPAVRPVIRLGVAAGQRSLGGRLQNWWAWRQEQRGKIGPPPGTVRPGLGGPQLAVATPAPGSADAPLDADLPSHSAAATRAALLATVEACAGTAGLCWDLGRDWLGGVRSQQAGWTTVPEPAFLAAVEHLEVCDALPAGHSQMPLLPGNVPYTTQLRTLAGRPLRAVTLDIAYDNLALRLGDRFQTLARSVTIIQRALRLTV